VVKGVFLGLELCIRNSVKHGVKGVCVSLQTAIGRHPLPLKN